MGKRGTEPCATLGPPVFSFSLTISSSRNAPPNDLGTPHMIYWSAKGADIVMRAHGGPASHADPGLLPNPRRKS